MSRPLNCLDGTYGNRTRLQSQDECSVCPPGSFCRGGLAFPCAKGTYFAALGATDQSQCVDCPSHSDTLLSGARSVIECVCLPGYYQVNSASSGTNVSAAAVSPICVPCPVGADCGAGAITLQTLKLNPGYYRISSASNDVRRCPDAGGPLINCSGVCTATGMKASTTSGCLGGEDVNMQCRMGLTGLFCELCEDHNGRYYQKASGSITAECLQCDGMIALRLGLTFLALLTLLGLRHYLIRAVGRLAREKPTLYEAITTPWARYQMGTKLKHIIGFYQIATKIPSVYEVTLPPDVQGLLTQLAVPLDLGLEWVISPLECVGIRGYRGRLTFWMVLPIVVVFSVLASFLLNEVRSTWTLTKKQKKAPKRDLRRLSLSTSGSRILAVAPHRLLGRLRTAPRNCLLALKGALRADVVREATLKSMPIQLKLLFLLCVQVGSRSPNPGPLLSWLHSQSLLTRWSEG